MLFRSIAERPGPPKDRLSSFSILISNHLQTSWLLQNFNELSLNLGCTDAAPRPAHPCPTRRDAATREGCRRPLVRAASCHVAIPELGRLGLYRPKRPSQAEIQKKKKKVQNAPFDLT